MPNATIAASASGDTTIIAASTLRRFNIRGLVLVSKGAVDVKFKSGSTDITGIMGMAANQALIVPLAIEDPEPWLLGTGINQAFVINLSAAVVVGGFCIYDFLEN